MLAAADPSQVPGLSRFFKTGPGQYGEGDKFLGIKVPVTRSIVKAHWKGLAASGDPFPELERCIGSEYHEVRLAALLTLVEIFARADKDKCIRFYLSHTDRINNWDLVDLSCYPLLGEWLLPQKDRSILYDLARNGKTIWEQRIGIVSTMTFVRHGELQDTCGLATSGSRKTQSGSPGGLSSPPLSAHAANHATLRHRKIPGAPAKAVP